MTYLYQGGLGMMKCTICGTLVSSIEEAIGKNWILSFYEEDALHGPACWDCSRSLLEICTNGEFAVRGTFKGKIIYQERCVGNGDEPLSMGLIFN